MPFLSYAGIGARVAKPVAAAAHDSEDDWSMDPDDARDYEVILMILTALEA